MQYLKRALITLALLCVTACSSTTFIYNRLDIILPWYIDDYVSLSRQQEKLLKQQLLPPYLYWHRMEELPQYIAGIASIENALDAPIELAFIQMQYTSIELAAQRLERETVSWMVTLGEQLSDEQMQEFLDYLQEQQVEYEEEYLSRNEQEYREESYDNFVDSASEFLGRLNKPQREMLRQAVEKMQRVDEPWLAERALWLVRLQQILDRDPGWQQELWAALEAREDNISEDYVQTYEHNLAVSQQVITDLLNSRTEKQDKKLRRRLRDLREDFEKLVAQGEASGPSG